MQYMLLVFALLIGAHLGKQHLTEEQKFMQEQKSACESESPADRECVLVFEYVEVEK